MSLQTKDLVKFLINSAFGPSTTRNQGKGIINAIRHSFVRNFDPDTFFRKLMAEHDHTFKKYLDHLTNAMVGKKGFEVKTRAKKKPLKIYTNDKVSWGIARKCTNILLRHMAYNGFMWSKYKIRKKDFKCNGRFQRLELPLDSYSFKWLQNEASQDEIRDYAKYLKTFKVSALLKRQSESLQELAYKISLRIKICRVDIDVISWRNESTS
jgi:hypothetical protein